MTAPGRTATPETVLDALRALSTDSAKVAVIREVLRAAEAPLRERIAELERLANDNAFSGMQHKARADTAEERVAELEAAIRRAGGGQ